MTAPAHLPLPDDEFARLATLHDYHVLDTEPDQHLIQLMRLAAHLYSVPIALVNIVDRDRQWAMASVGLHVKEAPREGSFTAQAVLEPSGHLIVEDATLDPRFVDSPYVAGPEHFRFFAGITLRAPNGHVLGALCLIDTEPRRMAVRELQHLQELASAVVTALSLHRTLFELKAMASADPLTGLANRAMLELVASRAVTQAIDGEYACAMLCVDMDKLRTVNDLFGQTGGDLLIHGAADRLRGILHEGDVLARIGGDTFAMLIPRMAGVAEAETMAERILRQLGEPFVIGGHPVPARPSVGIATCPADATKASELLRCADAALSGAKREGRGRFWRYEAGMEKALSARRALERDLRRAVEDRSFELLYQPIVATTTGVVCGFEALIRWHRPEHGLVPPAEFIAMAESAGLIRRIDEWVLRTACAEAAGWSHPVRVAVNISPASFASGQLPALVREALWASGLAADRLELELTERTVLEHTDEARADTDQIKRMGVRLSLDDFGTGYASLGYLEAFPLDKLKLDRSFVNGLGERPRAEAIARSVLGLGHALGMSICAEGVETPGQLAFLRAHGCDQVQGFLLGRPGPVDERTLTTVVGAALE